MMRLTALVALGGAIGSVGRFWLATAMTRLTGPGFPWGTVLINVAGSFVIGWLAGLTMQGRYQNAASLQAFAMAGLCGGFTTFSAFSLQTVDLIRAGQPLAAAANALGSVLLCVTAAAAGLSLGRL
jgi:CrcB protein